MNQHTQKNISKLMSLVLRHNPEAIGLQLNAQGWANASDLIEKLKKRFPGFNMHQLETIVAENDKQRFAFNESKTAIRASQGHSVAIDLDLEPVIPPDILFHGTVEKFIDSIKQKGLQKMERQHVHLSSEESTAVKVGSRRGKAIILKINSLQMQIDGLLFFQSANGVWLTDNVPADYISF